MIISNSTVGMESVRKYSSLRMDAYVVSAGSMLRTSPDIKVSASNSNINSGQLDNKSRGSFRNSLENLKNRFETMGTSRITRNHGEESEINRIKTECIIYLLRLLFGREVDDDVNSKNFKDVLRGTNTDGNNTSSVSYPADNTDEYDTGLSTANNITSPLMRRYNGIGASAISQSRGINSYEAHYFAETEEVSYSTTGTVITADGRELDFNLSFQMSRSFEEYYEREHTFSIGKLRDPLVINLDTDIASVSDQKFLFDIDNDGVKDNISMLNKSSGFLALDRNGDGEINDGSELFGTKSGDGFKDLAAFDSDGNGWIDEADPIWDKLLIYSMNEDGSSSMYGLSEKGVGAIYLGNVSTCYSLNNIANNNVNAVIRKTGMFLYENGRAGTVQHLDVAS